MKLYTVAETAQRWGCSVALIYRWIRQDRIASTKIGYFTLIESTAKRPKPRPSGRPKKETR